MEYRYYNSSALVEKFKAEGETMLIAYAKAFGACWAYLTQEQKHKLFTIYEIEIPEAK